MKCTKRPPNGSTVHARRQDDDWDSFNDRNSSLRLRFTGDNGAFDCTYSLHGKHPDSGTCSGPG